jgi:hypothetical protein
MIDLVLLEFEIQRRFLVTGGFAAKVSRSRNLGNRWSSPLSGV